jgi:phage terminase large subunit GpA-like protein
MDVCTDPKVRTVVGVFSAQMGKSTILENVIAYHAHHDPCPVMLVQPTLDIAEGFSKERIAPMIEDTPALKSRFAPAKSKTSGDTLLNKVFPGGSLTIAGANSYNSLASRPIQIVIGDEASKWRSNEKGSPFRQVSARVRGFWRSKLIFVSTPTESSAGNEFWQKWEQSDKRLYFVACPHCQTDLVFAFDENPSSIPSDVNVPRAILRWEEGAPSRTENGGLIRRAESAWFECCSCAGRIDDGQRRQMVRAGHWEPTQEFHGTAGFWGWQAMSPFASAAAVEIANEWLSALGSPITLQSAKNETLGLPWTETGDAPEWRKLFDRRETDRRLSEVPEYALILTAGVDVQQDRLEVAVYGWGRRKRHALVDYIVLHGDTARAEVWQDLTKVLGTLYRHPSGVDMPIRRLAIDSGYQAQRVYEWARTHRFGPVTVIKGGPATQTATISQPSPVEITVGGRKLDAGVKVVSLNVAHFKAELYGILRLDAPNVERGEEYPDGWLSIPELPDTQEFCQQITAEQLVTRTVKGYARRDWEKTRPRNEALDTWVYARAAAQMQGVDRYQDGNWSVLERDMGVLRAAIQSGVIQQASGAAAPTTLRPPARRQFRSSYMGR